MWDLLRNITTCMAAGVVLAIFFLTPEGAVVGALNGLLVAVCATLAERRAQHSELTVADAIPIRLIGSHADSIA